MPQQPSYSAKHRFPRIAHDTETEFATACAQVERIAELRLKDQLP